MPDNPRDKQVLFAIADDESGAKVIVLGFPEKAWRHMEGGNCHNFDLTKVGVPVKVICFGGKTHDHCMSMLQAGTALNGGTDLIDARDMDVAIKTQGRGVEEIIADELTRDGLEEGRAKRLAESIMVAMHAEPK